MTEEKIGTKFKKEDKSDNKIYIYMDPKTMKGVDVADPLDLFNMQLRDAEELQDASRINMLKDAIKILEDARSITGR